MASEEALIDSPAGVLSYLHGSMRIPGVHVIRNSTGGMQMAVEITGQVGAQSLAEGAQGAPLRQGRGGELMVSGLHGPYYEAARNGTIFTVANQAAVTTTVGLATT